MLLSQASPKRNNADGGKMPAFPKQQLFVLALCRICEPIAFMSIFPYAYYMVLSFNITSDTRKTAVYVGMITSAFAFAEFSSGVVWGRISDRFGRKPVLILGLAGTALSMMVFGFALSLPVALLGRALGGLLNGNMGVLQTTVAELVTVKEHQPRAYSIMPFVWCLGSVLGPALGGALAQPSKNFPSLFPQDTMFDRYPFLLPNVVCSAILTIGVVIGILFLEETHETKRHQRDIGLEAGKWLLHFLSKKEYSFTYREMKNDKLAARSLEEVDVSVDEEDLPEYSQASDADPPGYRTTDATPRQSSSRSQSPHARYSGDVAAAWRKPNIVRKTFTQQVVLTIVAFGILAYHSISFDQLMPVFLSQPIAGDPPSLPLHITGGFGYSSKKIGFMLAIQGIYSMIAQILIFPLAARQFGTLTTFRFVVTAWPLLYFLVPYTVLLPAKLQEPAVYLVLLSKITFQVLAFPSIAILLTNAAPSTLVLGTINGVSASMASLARACGPTITGMIHSWGLDLGSSGLAWWMSGFICMIGAVESLWMEEIDGRVNRSEDVHEEATLTEVLLDPAAIEAAISAVGEDDTQLNSRGLSELDSKATCSETFHQ